MRIKSVACRAMAFTALSIPLAACANGTSAGDSKPAATANPATPSAATFSTEPVTLTLYLRALTEDYAKQYIVSHIQKKLPYITIKTILEAKGTMPEDLIAAGTIPDLIFTPNNKFYDLKNLEMLADLTPLVKSHNMNLSLLDDGIINSIKKYSEKGELLMMPWGTANYALYYNKELFDKFGVPYPKDGMKWDDVYNLAVKLTKNDGGVQYRGFDFTSSVYLGYNQLSAPLVDSKTTKSVVTTDAWKKIFETFGRFVLMPGNESAGNSNKELEDFTKTRTLAMRAGTTMFPQIMALDPKNPLNFDIVTFPTFPEATNTSPQYLASTFAISAQSKYKDQAMEVIKLMLSDEVQKEGAGILRLTILKSEDVRNATGKDYPSISGKNIKALYANTLAQTKETTKYDEIARKVLPIHFANYSQGKKDVNTALREAEEEINKKITEEKGK